MLNEKLALDLRTRFDDKFGFYSPIADVPLRYIPFFIIYSEYLNNYERANARVKTLRTENPSFAKFLDKVEMTDKLSNNDLLSFLIKPVQRPPKYKLLFGDLLRHTDTDHPDHANIALAVQKFHNVNSSNNEAMVKYTLAEKIFDLQKYFGSKTFNIVE